MSRYFSPQQIEQIVSETEAEIYEAECLAKVQSYMDANPNYASDPMVQALRRMSGPGATAPQPAVTRTAPAPRAPQRTTAPPAKPATLPAVIDGNARFHPSHLKMKPASPQIDAVKDSYVHSPGSTIRQR